MLKVDIVLDASLEDLVEEWLWIRGAAAVSSQPPHAAHRVLTAHFEQDLDRDAFALGLKETTDAFEGTIHRCHMETVQPQDWQRQWRENFTPFEVGRFRIIGEWEEVENSENTIRVYPGQAFGTGQHETTQLVIRRLTELDLTGKRVLDAGCGTGILGIVAERLGAREVFGFDVDPDCAENMARHLSINRSERTRLEIGRLEDFSNHEPYDLVLANITINVLIQIWPQLPGMIKPGGLLLSSGILESQRDSAVTGLTAAGFVVEEIRTQGEWLLIQARRP